jgi:hypothetical protein
MSLYTASKPGVRRACAFGYREGDGRRACRARARPWPSRYRVVSPLCGRIEAVDEAYGIAIYGDCRPRAASLPAGAPVLSRCWWIRRE